MNMAYESLVAEYLDFELPAYVPREELLVSLPEPSCNNVITSVVGVRRCGKTFFLYQLMDELVRSGVPRNRVFHFAFNDEPITPLPARKWFLER